MAKQVTHHRTPDFRGLLAEVFAGLKYAFATENDVLVLTSSGTGAMEAAMVNLVPQGGKAIVLESGKFSERWRKIAETFGIHVV
jgi:serine---pyruvate transaminase